MSNKLLIIAFAVSFSAAIYGGGNHNDNVRETSATDP